MYSGEDRANESEDASTFSKNMLPPKTVCLGCRIYFIEDEKLQLQNIHVEFKNYNQIPLKETKHKLIILRTITAFLNTKGGAIYMGVEDTKCSIVGNLISKPKQDEFRSFIVDLCKQIYPPVDTKNGEVKTLFIPVMKRNGTFTGKYITKILINQGRTDTLYTFSQKIKLLSQKPTDCQDFQVRMGYVRIGPGGVQKLEGLKLYEQVYQRAKQPYQLYKPHEGCHPSPMLVNLELKTIAFRIERQKAGDVLKFIVKQTNELGEFNFKQNYDDIKRIYTIEYETVVIAELMRDTISFQFTLIPLNGAKFKFQGIEYNMYVFGPAPAITNISQPIPVQKQHSAPVIRQKTEKQKHPRQKQVYQPKSSLYYIFTHINTRMRDQFLEFLTQKLSKKCKFTSFINSVLIKTVSELELEQLKSMVKNMERQLHNFGHSGKIVFGQPTGHLHIYNYYEKEKHKLKDLIVSKYLKDKVVKFLFKNDNNDNQRTYADIQVQEKIAPEALDILLQSDQIRGCKMYSKDKGTSQPKMKFMLQCD